MAPVVNIIRRTVKKIHTYICIYMHEKWERKTQHFIHLAWNNDRIPF